MQKYLKYDFGNSALPNTGLVGVNPSLLQLQKLGQYRVKLKSGGFVVLFVFYAKTHCFLSI